MRKRTRCVKCHTRMKRQDDMWKCQNKECGHTKAWSYITKWVRV